VFRIGINSSAFEHFEDDETKAAVQGIGKVCSILEDYFVRLFWLLY